MKYIVFLFFISTISYSQTHYISEFSIKYSFKNKNFILLKNSTEELENLTSELFYSQKFLGNRSIVFGIIHQTSFDEELTESLVLSQQLQKKVNFFNKSFGSRLRFDENIQEDFLLRIRYRLSTDISLIGEKIDLKEPFLIIKNEFLFSDVIHTTSFENRTHVGMGYLFNTKFSINLEYYNRARNIFDNKVDLYAPYIKTYIFYNLN